MSERRAPRLLLEVLFLAALAAALTFADLEAYQIVGLMLLGWIIVAVFEWGALRGRPHYGSGLPPRWFVPPVTLPPPRPLEQLSAGYPAAEASNDAPTWIASPAMLAEWPVADLEPGEQSPPGEQTHVHDVLEVAVAVPEQEEALAEEEEEQEGAVAEAELEPEPAVPDPEAEPWDEEDEEDEAGLEDEPEPVPEPARPAASASGRVGTARHRLDPLAQPAAKSRRFGRRGEPATDDAEVPDGPPPGRRLPAQARGGD